MVNAKAVVTDSEVGNKYRLVYEGRYRAGLIKCEKSSQYRNVDAIGYVNIEDVMYCMSDLPRKKILEDMLQEILGPGNFVVEVDQEIMDDLALVEE